MELGREVWVTKVLWKVTIVQMGIKVMGVMKSLREGVKTRKVDKPLTITNLLGLGRRIAVAEKLRDQKLEENISGDMASRKPKEEISRGRCTYSKTKDVKIQKSIALL